MADEDDPVELSAHALSALNEFYREQALLQHDQSSVENVDEDWELSQFWYDDETASRLADECLRLTSTSTGNEARIACVCCPTLYKTLKRIVSASPVEKSGNDPSVKLILFEYDHRFGRYGDDFLFYDYREPFEEIWARAKGREDLRHSFDVVVADPPFLSEECVSKVANFVLSLKNPGKGRIIFCTGIAVEKFLLAALDNECMFVCDRFEPRHKRKLGNEFKCYVNYEGSFLS